ncbi:MAG: hypothetical protein DMF96_22590 [Acidobacteria bacterium]|nr:MAG: hypothetical protein DMF96_22590 [Acidobacteriota bacterium]
MRSIRMITFLCVLCTLGVLCARDANAQSRRPSAAVTALTERARAHGGDTLRVALEVSLPEGLHTQSDKPRDPLLIPTSLTIDAPAGVTVEELVFPPSTDLQQAGQDQPLAVFEREFLIGVQLKIVPAVPVGMLTVPAHLRYQACDAKVCYPPSTAALPSATAKSPAPRPTPCRAPDRVPLQGAVTASRSSTPSPCSARPSDTSMPMSFCGSFTTRRTA